MPRWCIPLATLVLAVAAALAVSADAAPAVRAPLLAAVMLALPGVGVWRGLRLQAPAVSIAGVVVLASLALDVVVAEILLLTGHLEPMATVGVLSAIGVVGTSRDLLARQA